MRKRTCCCALSWFTITYPAWGQTVAAFVSLRDGHTLSQSELQAFARASLADYKVPEEIHFVPKLPKGPTGKVNRRSLLISVRSEVDAAQQVVEARV